MGKASGLGAAFYIDGYDISGDINSLSRMNNSRNVLEVTGIDKSAMERVHGLRDGGMEFMSYHNDDAGAAFPVLKTMPTTDRIASYLHRTTIGSGAACCICKQIDYAPNRGNDGSLTYTTTVESNGFGLEWGNTLTAGKRTDTAATNGTGVSFDGTGYLSLPGSSGNYASTPDAASLDVVGDIDIRVHAAATDWTPAANQIIFSKYAGAGQRSWALMLTSSGHLAFQWTEDGTTVKSEDSGVVISATNGDRLWVRATMDVDVGGTDAEVKFYTSTDGDTWTQSGVTQTNGATTSIFSSTAPVELGTRVGGTADFFIGRIYSAQIRSGIDGTIVANPVAAATGITDSTGKVWTVSGTAYLASDTRFGLQAYLHVFSFTGTSVTVKLQSSPDNSTWTDVTGGGFTVVSSAPQAQRIQTTRTLIVDRYLRAVTTGTFTSAVFTVVVKKNTVLSEL